MKEINEITKYLPKGWEEKARELKALVRAREVKTAEDLLTVILTYLMRMGSFGATAAWLKLTSDIHLDKNAVYHRMISSGGWLKWMAETMAREDGFLMERPEWLKGNVVLIDGSELSVKGSKGGDYWLHYAMDLFRFQCRDLSITPLSEGETLCRHDLRNGDIAIADRGYCSIKGMEYVREQEADFIIRFRSKGFKIYDDQGKELNILERCQELGPEQSMSIWANYKVKHELRRVRLVIWRKDKESDQRSARKINRNHVRKQQKASAPETIELNHYLVVVTSLDIPKERILELYRARWQIEEVFYRLKGLFDFGEIPCKKEESVLAWLYGKLFVAFLIERLMKWNAFSPSEKRSFLDSIEKLWSLESAVNPHRVSCFSYHAGNPC